MTDDPITDERMNGKKDTQGTAAADAVSDSRYPVDISVWVIWGAIMILAIAVLPFAVRSQVVVRAIAHMCGFDIGSPSSR